MRAIQKGYLSFMIWSFAWNEKYVETRLVCREFRCHGFWSLDDPEVEDFTFHHKVVLEPDTLMDLIDGILRISRYDTVYECAIYSTSLLEPSLEALSEVPEFHVLIYTFLQFLAVKEYQLTRKDDETLGKVAVEMLISAIKELSKLSRIRRCRLVLQSA